MYLKEQIAAMEEELRVMGFMPLKTSEEVKNHLISHQGITLLFINSMCGCVGPEARLGVKMALETSNYQPDHLVTVFAGVDEEATEQVFEYTKPYPPSSPSVALFKNRSLVYLMERHQLKGNSSEWVALSLQKALEECSSR